MNSHIRKFTELSFPPWRLKIDLIDRNQPSTNQTQAKFMNKPLSCLLSIAGTVVTAVTPCWAGGENISVPSPTIAPAPTDITTQQPSPTLGSPLQGNTTLNSALPSPNFSLPGAGYPTANPQNCFPACATLGFTTVPGSSIPSITGSFIYSPNQGATDLQNELKKREQIQGRLIMLEARRQVNNDLATALEQKQWDRARILAFQLVGAKNYRDYLMRVTGGQFPNP
jgi:hypothetical protein